MSASTNLALLATSLRSTEPGSVLALFFKSNLYVIGPLKYLHPRRPELDVERMFRTVAS